MAKARPDYWRSPAILWFLRRAGKVDPEEAVKAETEKLLLAAGLTKPPFEPSRVAPLRKIVAIRRADIPVISQLTPVKGGFIITIKRANSEGVRSPQRDTFSIAHEIGHTLFYDIESTSPTRLQGDFGSLAEERLCDIFAAELLMPEQRFKSDARAVFEKVSSWCDTLFQLRSLYQISMRAVAERIVDLKIIEESVIIKWRWKSKPGDDQDFKLRVDWSIPLKNDKHYFVWPDKPAPEGTAFIRASTRIGLLREEANLRLGILRGDFIVEAKGYHDKETDSNSRIDNTPKSVLSIVWPKISSEIKRD